MENVEQTIISQYANSPTLVQLIQNMNGYIDPGADIDSFYDCIFNVATATDFGLDIWGKIVNVSRFLNIPGTIEYFGFQEGPGYAPFGYGTFWTGTQQSTVFRLSTEAYRTLIFVKALSNISDCTVPSLNRILQNLFATRGRCYVTDPGGMQLVYIFEFALLPFELAIMTQSGAVPRPAGVGATVIINPVANILGFNEAGAYRPFGSGVFFNSSVGIYDAS